MNENFKLFASKNYKFIFHHSIGSGFPPWDERRPISQTAAVILAQGSQWILTSSSDYYNSIIFYFRVKIPEKFYNLSRVQAFDPGS